MSSLILMEKKMKSLGITDLKVNHKCQDYIMKCDVINRNVSNILGHADSLRLHSKACLFCGKS